jgi:hypothetical protein
MDLTDVAALEAMSKLAETEAGRALVVPVFKSIGDTFRSAWYWMTAPLELASQKRALTNAHEIAEFKKSLEQKAQLIPDEHLIEPKFSVVAPALEASKYYFEEPELREMFASLVAGAMDGRVADKVHPSFVEIIKQMSPRDAEVLTWFEKRKSYPICDIKKLDVSDLRATGIIFLLPETEEYLCLESFHREMYSLCRLGLLETSFIRLHNEERFSHYKKLPFYTEAYECNKKIGRERETLEMGLVQRTPTGADFISVCLQSQP